MTLPQRSSSTAPAPTPAAGREPGQSLVEFALGLLVFLLMVFGIFEFGRAIYTYSVVAHAAREGARVGAVRPTPGVAAAAARDAAIGVSIVAVETITPDSVIVQASTTFTAVTPLIGAALPEGGLTLRTTARQFREVR
jgi:Flp pilus assembly protein TadG